MATTAFKSASAPVFSSSLFARVDEFFGSLLSVKPSIIAKCFSDAMKVSGTIGAEELSSVSGQKLQAARRAMGLDA